MKKHCKKEQNVEVDWIINTRCNFDCEYCNAHTREEHPDVGRVGNDQLVSFFNKRNLDWTIHITGGEPFLYPKFVDLCEKLSKNHVLNLNTNLTSLDINRFVEVIEPKKVTFINCGLHIKERERRGLVRDFIEKTSFLIENDFPIFVSYVMYPPLFKRFQKDFDFFKSEGIIISPKCFRGKFLGNRYPYSYTREEKGLFKKFSRVAEKELKARTKIPPSPLIDLSVDRKFLDGLENFHGQKCAAGRKFIRIWPNGRITRCGRKHILGNIFRDKLELYERNRVCDSYSCPYFCYRFLEKNN